MAAGDSIAEIETDKVNPVPFICHPQGLSLWPGLGDHGVSLEPLPGNPLKTPHDSQVCLLSRNRAAPSHRSISQE